MFVLCKWSRWWRAVAAIVLVVVFPGTTGYADTCFSFQPDPKDLFELDHDYFYSWGIDWQLPQTDYITSATLHINNLNNWRVEDDILYIHLLDDPTLGVVDGYDGGGGGDDFAGQGVLLTTFTDDNEFWDAQEWINPPEDFVYNFTPDQIGHWLNPPGLDDLTNYASDGRWGLGFDADAPNGELAGWMYNCGIELEVCTEVIPEPGTLALVLPALGVLGWIKRRRSAA